MKSYLVVVLLFVSIISVSAQKPTLKRTVILEDYIALALPSNLKPMNEEDKKARFPRGKVPALALSNEYSDMFLSMSATSEIANETAIPFYLKNYSEMFSVFYTSAEVLNSKIKTVKGKQVGYIEFTATDLLEEVYHCFFFTNLEGKLLTFDFVCPKAEKDKWSVTVMEMIDSLEIK